MPRITRGLADGLTYHILNRSNADQKIFHKDEDYDAFVNLITEAKREHAVNIFSYCLMPTHFHMAIRAIKAEELSRFMQWLMTSHVRRYHAHYKTSGHVWQGRFKSFIIQQDNHLLVVLRYIEANPVRGNLVSSAKDWPWSSCKIRCGMGVNPLIDNVPIELPKNWIQYVNSPLIDSELDKIRLSIIRKCPFGTLEWQAEITKRLGLQSTIRPRGRPMREVKK